MNFHAKWKSFIKEEQSPTLLLEARVKDIKSKYPKLDQAGWLVWARRQIEDVLGPRGTSKYLMWVMRALHSNFKEDIEELEDEEDYQNFARDSDVLEVGNVLIGLVIKFQDNQSRLDEKDIYKYNSADLQGLLAMLGPTSKVKRTRKKEQAREGSEVVYDAHGIFAIRPYTEEAACYYGQNTKWCISATEAENYFNQYTSDDLYSFVLIRFDNLPETSRYKKISLQIDEEAEIETLWDARNLPTPDYEETLQEAVAESLRLTRTNFAQDVPQKVEDITKEIIERAIANVRDNPVDRTAGFAAAAQEIEQEFSQEVKHAYFSHDIDDYFYFSGGLDIEIPEDTLEGGEYEFPSDWRALANLASELEDLFSKAAVAYDISNIEIEDYDGKLVFRIEADTGSHEANPSGYRSFLHQTVLPLDEKKEALRRLIIRYLIDEKYMPTSAFMSMILDTESVQKQFKRLKVAVDTTPGYEFLDLRSELIALPDGVDFDSIQALSGGKEKLRTLVVNKLQGLNKKVAKLLDKQLNLPISDLPQKIIQDLEIPNTFRVGLVDASATKVFARVAIHMGFDDSQESLSAAIEVGKFIDQHFDQVEQAVQQSVAEIQSVATSQQTAFPMAEVEKEIYTTALQYLPRNNFHGGPYVSQIEEWFENPGNQPGKLARDAIFRELWNELSRSGAFPPWENNPYGTSPLLESEAVKYFTSLREEKGRSRQRGIYKFVCMIGYETSTGQRQRGLDDIASDIRALPNVTIVDIVISNRRLGHHKYIAGIAIKFIPTVPGQTISSPEEIKVRIIRDIRRLKNVHRIFRVSTSFERLE